MRGAAERRPRLVRPARDILCPDTLTMVSTTSSWRTGVPTGARAKLTGGRRPSGSMAAPIRCGFREYAHLDGLAASTGWDRRPVRSLSVARAIYPRLPGDARLWLRAGEFMPPDMQAIVTALGI